MGRNNGTAGCVRTPLADLQKQDQKAGRTLAVKGNLGAGRCGIQERNGRERGGLRTFAKWTIVLIETAYLYRAAAGCALEQRGYTAVGGEALLLLLPVIFYIMERMVKDTIQDLKREIRDREADTGRSKKGQKKTAPRLLCKNKSGAEFAGDTVH